MESTEQQTPPRGEPPCVDRHRPGQSCIHQAAKERLKTGLKRLGRHWAQARGAALQWSGQGLWHFPPLGGASQREAPVSTVTQDSHPEELNLFGREIHHATGTGSHRVSTDTHNTADPGHPRGTGTGAATPGDALLHEQRHEQ